MGELSRQSAPVRGQLVFTPLGPTRTISVRVVGDVTDVVLTLALVDEDGHELRVQLSPAPAAYIAGSLAARAGVILGAPGDV